MRATILLLLVTMSANADGVARFRGTAGTGVTDGATFPFEWAKGKNIAWRAEVPGGGWSAPVVAGNRVFLTTAESGDFKPKNFTGGVADMRSFLPWVTKGPDKSFRFDVLCLDRATGKRLWRKTAIEARPKYGIHPSNSYATETPATDGKRVYSLFAAVGTLIAHDLDGKEAWKKDLGVYKTSAGFGTGSSLAVGMGLVFVQYDNDENSFVAAFDGKTGKEKWRVQRKTKTSWATPLLWKNSRRTELVACGAGRVTSYDPTTGKALWTMGKVSSSFAASPTADADRLYFGSSGPGSSSPLYAVKAGASGDISLKGDETSNAHVAWRRLGAGPGMASPVAGGGLLYVVGSTGLSAHDGATGEVKYKQRLVRAKTIVSSLMLAGNKLLLLDESGQTFVIKAGPNYELLGTNTLPDTFWSTPAVDGDSLLLRGLGAVYCIRRPVKP